MITAKNLYKSYGKLKVLKDISIQCNRGQSIALIGPNGSGKTTFIKCLLGMAVPDSGSLMIEGKDTKNHWMYRRDIGYMPQIGRYPDNMTIGQVIDMMKDIRKESAGGLDTDLMDAFKIDTLLNKRMRTLSGGTRQKVSACLAFLFNPSILILDEPTAGLDPLSSELLKEKIKRERQKDKLILITSHILSDLDEIISQVIFLQDGSFRFHKSLEQLKEDTGQQNLVKAIAKVMQGGTAKSEET